MKKRNKTVRNMIIAAVVLAGAAGVGYALAAPEYYETIRVTKSDIQEMISETGIINSAKKKTYYMDSPSVIKTLDIQTGDRRQSLPVMTKIMTVRYRRFPVWR